MRVKSPHAPLISLSCLYNARDAAGQSTFQYIKGARNIRTDFLVGPVVIEQEIAF